MFGLRKKEITEVGELATYERVKALLALQEEGHRVEWFADETGIKRNTVGPILSRLHRERLAIVDKLAGGRYLYFPKEYGEYRLSNPIAPRKYALSRGEITTRNEIIECLRGCTEPVFPKRIAEALGMSKSGVERHLRDMLDSGVVTRAWVPTQDGTTHYYKYWLTSKELIKPKAEEAPQEIAESPTPIQRDDKDKTISIASLKILIWKTGYGAGAKAKETLDQLLDEIEDYAKRH